MKNRRREFLASAALGGIGLGLGAACGEKEKAISQASSPQYGKRFKWKMFTTWPPNFPLLGEGCVRFSEWVEKMSGGRMKIRVFGGGEIVPAMETFEAVKEGIAEIGNSASYYWAGKIPSSQLFASVPFGFNAQQMNTWMLAYGGEKLWREIYEPFNLIPFPSGNTGVQMGGWFNKRIESMGDIRGLKMRIPGLGGKIWAKAGGTPVLVSGGEIYTNLERGVIDATEWIGPYHDYLMGFHEVAQYYYYPGWHEPGTTFESFVNREKYLELPEDLQEIVASGFYRMNLWILSQFELRNAEYFKKIMDSTKVKILPFPGSVLGELKKFKEVVIKELIEEDASSKKIYDSIKSFSELSAPWSRVSEKEYHKTLSS
jgi:TRAP-type mannitol/chloroaromatic compound transport system substrate-binding protein